uniref:Dual specificity protein phosphatase n=1 Tax=Kryptolebias marmoratus TaxID=37003 RepID=A0A3Q3GE17_KRYMA
MSLSILSGYTSSLGNLTKQTLKKNKNADSSYTPPSVKELQKVLFGGKRFGNHLDEVWPNLFIGDMSVANDRYSLWKQGITHVVNAAHGRMYFRVLVHCAVGVSRSASLVLAYLMIHHGYTLLDAIGKVKERRWIFPNGGFLRQLRALDVKLRKK